MTIAVTAASGQLGQGIVSHLLDRVPASEVIAVIRDPAKAAPLTAKGVEVRIADYTDRDALTEALAGIDKMVLISSNEIGQRATQHANVIDAAKEAGVGYVAYTSLLHADTSPLLLAPEHAETERRLAEAGIAHSFLRNGWYHENQVTSIPGAREMGTVLTSAGEGRVASAARDDFAEAAAIVVTSDSPEIIYELSGDTAWTQEELAEAISAAIDAPVTVTHVNSEAHREALTQAGLDDPMIDFAVSVDGHIAQGALADMPGTLSDLLGRPTTALADTLRDMV
ncbi:MAG: SDR family oxidoreductase [Microthrixaceae bacterium]